MHLTRREDAIAAIMSRTRIMVRDGESTRFSSGPQGHREDVREITPHSFRNGFEEAHYAQVMARVAEQLKEMPGSLLEVAANTTEFGACKKKPLTIVMMEGARDAAGLSLAEISHVLRRPELADLEAMARVPGKSAALAGLFDVANTQHRGVYEGRMSPPYNEHMGVLLAQWNVEQAVAPLTHKDKVNSGELAHEMGHYYLNHGMSHEHYMEFTNKLLGALRADIKGVTPVFMEIWNNYGEKYGAKSQRDEIFTFALGALCGGRAKPSAHANDAIHTLGWLERRERGLDKPFFNFERCPNLLGVLLEEMPDLLPQVKKHAPYFAKDYMAEHNIRNVASWVERTTEAARKPGKDMQL